MSILDITFFVSYICSMNKVYRTTLYLWKFIFSISLSFDDYGGSMIFLLWKASVRMGICRLKIKKEKEI